MRQIKFRAKAYNGEWVFGYYFSTGKSHFIRNEEGTFWAIDIDTLGQFTGVYTDDKKEIYEGDIVSLTWIIKPDKYPMYETVPGSEEYLRDFEPGISDKCSGEIRYENAEFILDDRSYGHMEYHPDDMREIKVLGNIYDNPELLEDWQNIQRYAEGEELEWRAVWNDKGKIEKFEITFEK